MAAAPYLMYVRTLPAVWVTALADNWELAL
jgi:hypothetical protein